ncbi:MAG: DMT family transporter [Burkholderiaceae bacterium]|jgi:drug/metabolite transporter (DMT)-like permease
MAVTAVCGPRLHARAVGVMVLVTLMWSLAGVVTRHLDDANGPSITLWRSLFAALSIALYLAWPGTRRGAQLSAINRWTVASGALWCTMFCCFMFALARTTVANTLVVYSLAPLMTAVLAAVALGTSIERRTKWAIGLASVGLIAMFAHDFDPGRMSGVWIALGVPLASALNLVLMKKADGVEFVPALLIGCALSILLTAPFVLTSHTSPHDIGLLAFLGVVQLGVPCILMVRAMPHLSAPEASLLDLLEIVFGVLWAWIGANEVPSSATLLGGLVVLAGLVLHEMPMLRVSLEPAS